MAHLRLRKFNTRNVWKGQDISNDLSMVVRAGNLVFVRGQTAMDLKGKIHGINDRERRRLQPIGAAPWTTR